MDKPRALAVLSFLYGRNAPQAQPVKMRVVEKSEPTGTPIPAALNADYDELMKLRAEYREAMNDVMSPDRTVLLDDLRRKHDQLQTLILCASEGEPT